MDVTVLKIFGVSPPIRIPAGFKLVAVRPTIVAPRLEDSRRDEKRRQRDTRRDSE
jgi:hypothetical protein